MSLIIKGLEHILTYGKSIKQDGQSNICSALIEDVGGIVKVS